MSECHSYCSFSSFLLQDRMLNSNMRDFTVSTSKAKWRSLSYEIATQTTKKCWILALMEHNMQVNGYKQEQRLILQSWCSPFSVCPSTSCKHYCLNLLSHKKKWSLDRRPTRLSDIMVTSNKMRWRENRKQNCGGGIKELQVTQE